MLKADGVSGVSVDEEAILVLNKDTVILQKKGGGKAKSALNFVFSASVLTRSDPELGEKGACGYLTCGMCYRTL